MSFRQVAFKTEAQFCILSIDESIKDTELEMFKCLQISLEMQPLFLSISFSETSSCGKWTILSLREIYLGDIF